MAPKNDQKPSSSISLLCCCSCKTKASSDEIHKYFGKEFTEYEYVIENLAIKRAPKVLLDSIVTSPKKSLRTTQTIKSCVRDCSTLAVKASPQEVVLGPVVEPALSRGDCSVSKDVPEKFDPCCVCPKGALAKQTQYRCLIRDKERDDFILKKVLLPPSQIQRVEHPKMQVVADIHKSSEENGAIRKEAKPIPPEIEKIIEALKVAKPQLPSTSMRRNKLNLMRSVSDTSCENKETFCNFLGGEVLKGETTEDTRSSLNDYCPDFKQKNLSKLFQQSKKTVDVPTTVESSSRSSQNCDEYCTSQIFLIILIIKYVFLIICLLKFSTEEQ